MDRALDWLFGPAPHHRILHGPMQALLAASDASIALACLILGGSVWRWAQTRAQPGAGRSISRLFALFLASCGISHLVAAFFPGQGLHALTKGASAVLSLMTAATLPYLAPRLARLSKPEALAVANTALEAEALAHEATLNQLTSARGELERRVAQQTEDLRVANARFQAALANTDLTLFEQDAELRYTWVYNAPFGLGAEGMVGRTEAEFMEPDSAARVQAVKRESLDSGEPRRAEVEIETDGGSGWFDLRVEPHRLRDGRPGLIASSTDVTAARRHDQHLRTVMQELNHRSKNLLTIVQSIARQTARGLDVPEEFQGQLGERLRALAHTHDVLVQENWIGADLRSVVEAQLRPQLDAFDGRIVIEGEPVSLPPGAAHYVGLAIHELGVNASKYGALTSETGRVRLDWTLAADLANGRRLALCWKETGGPRIDGEAERRGFGRSILEALTPRAMNGTATLAYDPDGVSWRLEAPLGPPG